LDRKDTYGKEATREVHLSREVSRGIGAGTVLMLAGESADVVISDAVSADKATDLI
jgi:hypothetical protein